MRTKLQRLFAPVPADRLAWFRVFFGALMAYEAVHWLVGGWVTRYYVQPTFHFTYYGFGWIRPLPPNGMYALFVILALLGVAIAFGWKYRLSMALFTIGFAYVFLLDKAFYLNHWYLIALIGCIMSTMRTPFFKASVPAWNLWLLRGQIVLVYFFAGVAKIDPDWLRGQPLAVHLASRVDFPLLGPLFGAAWAPLFFSYSGLALDLLVGPALLWRRTRIYALIASASFHLLNSILFDIGIFPWLMLALTFTLFLPEREAAKHPEGAYHPPSMRHQRRVLAFIAAWAIVQIAMPLRHFLYPGTTNWTMEGHRFAWRMMLQDKQGLARLYATHPVTRATSEIAIAKLLTPIQYSEMVEDPDMILQMAHHVADTIEAETGIRPIVRAFAEAKLNDHPVQMLIDPKVDLAAQPRSLRPAAWIIPLEPRK